MVETSKNIVELDRLMSVNSRLWNIKEDQQEKKLN